MAEVLSDSEGSENTGRVCILQIIFSSVFLLIFIYWTFNITAYTTFFISSENGNRFYAKASRYGSQKISIWHKPWKI